MAFSIKIEGLEKLQQSLGRSGNIVNNRLGEAMNVSTTKVKSNIRAEITNQKINNQGTLRESVDVVESTPRRGVVGVGEKYGLYIEKGTRPHFPPVAPLERWAQTKLGKKGIGFLIARKISRVGTKAKPFVEPAFEKSKSFVTNAFKVATRKITEDLAK